MVPVQYKVCIRAELEAADLDDMSLEVPSTEPFHEFIIGKEDAREPLQPNPEPRPAGSTRLPFGLQALQPLRQRQKGQRAAADTDSKKADMAGPDAPAVEGEGAQAMDPAGCVLSAEAARELDEALRLREHFVNDEIQGAAPAASSSHGHAAVIPAAPVFPQDEPASSASTPKGGHLGCWQGPEGKGHLRALWGGASKRQRSAAFCAKAKQTLQIDPRGLRVANPRRDGVGLCACPTRRSCCCPGSGRAECL